MSGSGIRTQVGNSLVWWGPAALFASNDNFGARRFLLLKQANSVELPQMCSAFLSASRTAS
jgi:hypothetical protein